MASRLRFTGTHTAPFMGIELQGRTIDLDLSITFEVGDGKLVDFGLGANFPEWFQSLGADLSALGT